MDFSEGFRLADYEITPADGRVSRDGQLVTTLSPRPVELLLVLVRSAGQVVSRDDLMSTVWPDTVVSEDTLTHYLSELRRALGDSSRDQRIIETLPKRGYRLLVQPEPMSTTTMRRFFPAAAAVLALLVVGTGSWFLAAAPAADPVLVIARIAHDNNAAVAIPAERYTLTLYDRLRSLQGIRVSMADSSAEPTALAAEDPETYVLYGDISADTSLDERLILRLFLSHSNRFGRPVETPIGRFEINGDEPGYFAELPVVRDQIVARIKEHLSNLIREDRGGMRATTDAEAYRFYLLAGELQIHEPACGESGRALLERALEIDPDFADGWSLLGYTHWTELWSCGGGVQAANLAIDAADRALAIDPRYESAHYLKVNVLAQVGRYADAYAFVQRALSEQPDSAYLHASRSVALRYGGLVEEAALAAQRAIEVDPQIYVAGLFEAPLAMLYAGQLETFLRHMPAIDDSLGDFYAAYSFLASDRAERAARRLQETAQRRREEQGTFTDLSDVLLMTLEGRRADAVAALETHVEARRALGSLDGEITFKQAQLFALAGADQRALELLAQAADEGFVCIACAKQDFALSRLASQPAFVELERALQAQHQAFRLAVLETASSN